jgi:uncharacterized protein (DUF952 family)
MGQAVSMAAGEGRPRRIFHIAFERDWKVARAAGSYEVSTRGLSLGEVGFIHAGFERQVESVGSTVYSDVTEPLVVLVIDTGRLEAPLVVEDVEGSDDVFPHIYGPLNIDAVVDVRPAGMSGVAFRVGGS